jgi:hypothetical protein
MPADKAGSTSDQNHYASAEVNYYNGATAYLATLYYWVNGPSKNTILMKARFERTYNVKGCSMRPIKTYRDTVLSVAGF